MRTPYNYDTDQASYETGLYCTDPSRTQQQFTDEVNINNIMRDFGITGQLPQNIRAPIYADFSESITDFQTAQNIVREAKESFMKLPAKVRERFHNNPQELLEFVHDDANADEATKLGLTIPKPPEQQQPVDKPPAA